MFYSIGLILATAGSALACFYPLADAFGLLKVAVGLIGAAILWLSSGRLRRTALDAPLVACAAAFLLSWAYSVDPILGLLGVYGQPAHGLAALLPAVLIFYAVASNGERWPDGPFVCAALVALGQGIAVGAQLAGFVPEFAFQGGNRAIGLAGGPTFLGAVLAPCLPACLWLGLRGGAAGALGIAGGIGGFLAITAAGSRGPWIAVGAGVLASLAASGRFRPGKWTLAACVAVLGVLAARSGAMGKARSDSDRLMTWTIAARAGAQHPVLGWGPDTFPLANRALKTPAILRRVGDGTIQGSAHNLFLQIWATMGGLGLLAYLWLCGALFMALAREAAWERFLDAIPGDMIGPSRGRAAAVLGALAALFVAAKFNPIPASAFYIAAALAGTVVGRPWRAPRWAWVLGVGALVATAPAVGRQMAAEALHSFGNIALGAGDLKAGTDLLRQANEIAPHDINYANARIIILRKLSDPAIESPRREFAKRALRVAAGAVKGHPQDPGAYELMATAELFAAPMFGPGLSRAALRSAKRASELDPLMEFSAVQWAQAAFLVGDNHEMTHANARLYLVRSLKN